MIYVNSGDLLKALVCRVGLGALIALASGCTYLHSPERHSLAEEARSDFEAITEGAPFRSTPERVRSFSQLEQELSREIHELRSSTERNTFLSRTWEDLLRATTDQIGRLEDSIQSSSDALEGVQARLATRLADQGGVAAASAAAHAALNAAERSRARFEASETLVTCALITLNDKGERGSLGSLLELLESDISYRQFDDLGAVLDDEQTESIASLIGIPDEVVGQLKAAEADGIDAEGVQGVLDMLKDVDLGRLDIGLQLHHPGINTTVLGMALDLAIANEARLTAEIASARQELKAHKAYIDYATALADRLRKNAGTHKDQQGGGPRFLSRFVEDFENQRVRDTLAEFTLLVTSAESTYRAANADRIRAEAALKRSRVARDIAQARLDDEGTEAARQAFADAQANVERREENVIATTEVRDLASDERRRARGYMEFALKTLAQNYRFRVLDIVEGELLEDRLHAIQVERAVAVASANLDEREAVINRGLEGLVAFHRAGFSTDDLDLIIQIAQAVGIGVLAGVV